ncbi:hypothetical protein PINS_up020464 [Pythium insidiosum]|nr:hypothetical protein PINS_up020464 [Pythium insidiosum]
MGVDKSRIGSYVAGILFGVGWWILIDGAASAAHNNSQIPFNFIKYLPGIGSSLAFFLINSIDWEMLSADSMTYHDGDGRRLQSQDVRAALRAHGPSERSLGPSSCSTHTYVDNAFQETDNVLIFLSTLVMRAGLIASSAY